MCKCLTSFDILNKINQKRSKSGLEEVPHNWLMCQHRSKWVFHKPVRVIGPSLVWDHKTANMIVSMLWKIPYRSYRRYYSEVA